MFHLRRNTPVGFSICSAIKCPLEIAAADYFVASNGAVYDAISNKQKYVHEVLVNCLFKLAQEKVWLGELTVPP